MTSEKVSDRQTILLLVEHQQNRYLLSQWLTDKYRVLFPEVNFATESETLLAQSYDLCLIDSGAVQQLRQKMLAKRAEEVPLFLPFVFLTNLQEIGLSTDHLEPLVDDVINIPIEKAELRTKLRVLLRSRSYSLQLQQAREELNQSLAQEQELNQLKSRFVSTVSHEFRNPLNGISGMTQLLQAYGDKMTPEKKTEVLAGLQRNVSKMTDLIDNVLVVSKKDLGKLQFNPAPLDLEAFCRNIISEVQSVFNRKQPIEFLYQCESKIYSLDRKLLHHILTNLLSNGCKYSDSGTAIDFEVIEENAQIQFTIRDRGIGIPAPDLPKLFNSFYRASNSEGFQGTGLGLTIAQDYTETHQGAIAVVSKLGVGTTFTVTIPTGYTDNI